MDLQQREIWYSGHVQGVGFRYTAAMVARRYCVTGFVQNLADGRVHLVVEGERDELDGFTEAVLDRMGSQIREVREDRRPAVGGFTTFGIR